MTCVLGFTGSKTKKPATQINVACLYGNPKTSIIINNINKRKEGNEMISTVLGVGWFVFQALAVSAGYTTAARYWKNRNCLKDPTLTDYCRHVFIQGCSGSGKTTMIITMLYELAPYCGYTFMTVKRGDVAKIASTVRPEDVKRSYIIKPSDSRRTVGLNPFFRTSFTAGERDFLVSEFLQILRVTGMLPSGSSIIEDAISCALGCLFIATTKEKTQVTPLDLTRTLEDEDYKHWIYNKAYPINPVLADGLKAYKADDKELKPTMRRLRRFFTNDTLQAMFCQPDGFDFKKALAEKWLSFWDLSNADSGCADFLAAVVLSKFKGAALARDERQVNPYHLLVCDEAQNYVDDSIKRLVAEARSRNVSLWMVCQSGEAQLTSEQQGRIIKTMSMCGTQICFKLASEDAPKAAKLLKAGGVTDQDLQNMPERWYFAKRLVHGETLFVKVKCKAPPQSNPDTVGEIRLNTKSISKNRSQVLAQVRRTYTAAPGAAAQTTQPRGRALWASDSKTEISK